MKIVGLSGSQVGSKTRTAMDLTLKAINEKYFEVETTLFDLADYKLEFSDGRNYLDYEGDTGCYKNVNGIRCPVNDKKLLIISLG